jgi:membrane associated rhomboid family serine protease
MTPTPVGMRCPECAKQKTPVRNINTVRSTGTNVTIALIVINVIAFVASGQFSLGGASTTSLFDRGALFGPSIAINHEYYRLITGGFLHAGLIHIGFNMYLLWILGQQLERAIGSARFGTLYFTALLWGSFGALVQTTTSPVVGASGAVFGLMGVLAVEQRRRGYDPFSGGLGGLILLNLAIGFIPGFHIAFGGHIGGLIGGVLAGLAFHQADNLRRPRVGYVGCVALAAVAVAGAIAVSGNLHNYSL